MPAPNPQTFMDHAWQVIGVAAACIFYGRFYLQWIVSERRGRSVVPALFWYMSGSGSFLLLCFAAFHQHSPIGALSHSFNMLIYSRNLVHIWREKESLTPRRYWIAHALAGLVIVFAVGLLSLTWFGLWQETRAASAAEVQRTVIWIAVGVAGQGLFACRFLLQWAVTEAKRKSVIPAAFWYISLAAACLLSLSHFNRPQPEWVFVIGLLSTLPIYLRNIWLLRRGGEKASSTD